MGGSAIRTGVIRRGLLRRGDVTVALLDDLPADRPGRPTAPPARQVVLTRASWRLPPRLALVSDLLCGRHPWLDRAVLGNWVPEAPIDLEGVDLVWFCKISAALRWQGKLPEVPVVVDFDDLEESTRHRPGSSLLVLDRWVAAGLRRRVARRATLVCVCSEQDRARLAMNDAVVVPNAAEGPAAGAVDAPSREPRLLFVGVLGYAPNRDGISWFAREVLPLLRQAVPGVEVRVVGPGAERLPADVRAAVDATGAVPDLDEHYRWARAVIAPLRFGSGTRIKILEAMAHGRPIISTTAGADGIDGVAGSELLLADGPSDFASACAEVLLDDEVAGRLAHAARALFSGTYATERVEAAVADVARAALGTGRARLWVDIGSTRLWHGTPHGIARVEAGLARGLAGRLPSARAMWVADGRVRCGSHADLLGVTDGRESTAPGFDRARDAPGWLRGGALTRHQGLLAEGRRARARLAVELGVSVLPQSIAAPIWRTMRRADETSARRRQTPSWDAGITRNDIVLVTGVDWMGGVVSAVSAVDAAARPRLWVLIHDILPAAHPELLCNDDVGVLFTGWLRQVAGAAERILFVSEESRRDFLSFMAAQGVAVPAELAVLTPVVDIGEVPAREPVGFPTPPRPYVVYVSTIERRKNHVVLLQAVRSAVARGEVVPMVVFVGSWGWGTENLREELMRDAALRDRIVVVDGLPDAEMRWLLEHAEAVVFPSRFEGFGLPVVEARQLGRPIIAADVPSLHEAAGPDAVYLDPHDSGAWRDALVAIASGATLPVPAPMVRSWSDAAGELLSMMADVRPEVAVSSQGGGSPLTPEM